MDLETLEFLIAQLPRDATGIVIKGLDSVELFFNSNVDYIALNSKTIAPAQRGTYKGPKKRWRISADGPVVSGHGRPIDISKLPTAE